MIDSIKSLTPITPTDTPADLGNNPFAGVIIGTGGTLDILDGSGTRRTTPILMPGVRQDIIIRHVYALNTTALDIQGYRG